MGGSVGSAVGSGSSVAGDAVGAAVGASVSGASVFVFWFSQAVKSVIMEQSVGGLSTTHWPTWAVFPGPLDSPEQSPVWI